MCGGNKRSEREAGEYDIARLVADEKGASDAGGSGETHHTHAVGQVVDDPYFVIVGECDSNRFEADRDAGLELKTSGCDIEDLQRVIGGVNGEQPWPSGDMAIGRTWPLSYSINEGPVGGGGEAAVEAPAEGLETVAIKSTALLRAHAARIHLLSVNRFN
jgi:hypothetical protein